MPSDHWHFNFHFTSSNPFFSGADLKKKEEILHRFAETPAKPIFAFVTFDRAAGREACLETFNGNSFLYNYLYNQHYKLKGKWLAVEGSPEPSTILWENLAYDKWVSGRRRVLTSIIALLMILISLALIFSAKYLDQVPLSVFYRVILCMTICRCTSVSF